MNFWSDAKLKKNECQNRANFLKIKFFNNEQSTKYLYVILFFYFDILSLNLKETLSSQFLKDRIKLIYEPETLLCKHKVTLSFIIFLEKQRERVD